jgi:hypothetical protein
VSCHVNKHGLENVVEHLLTAMDPLEQGFFVQTLLVGAQVGDESQDQGPEFAFAD